jgi:hypothetical protein
MNKAIFLGFLALVSISASLYLVYTQDPVDTASNNESINSSSQGQSQKFSDFNAYRVENLVFYGNNTLDETNLEIRQNRTLKINVYNEGGVHDLYIPNSTASTEVMEPGENGSLIYTFKEEGTIPIKCSLVDCTDKPKVEVIVR